MGSFLYFVINGLLSLLVWAIIISAVLSWLVAFDVINLRNRVVYNIAHFLDAVTRPILAPARSAGPSARRSPGAAATSCSSTPQIGRASRRERVCPVV